MPSAVSADSAWVASPTCADTDAMVRMLVSRFDIIQAGTNTLLKSSKVKDY